MSFDLEEHVSSILKARKGHEQAGHMWHYGFYAVIHNNSLDNSLVNVYLEQEFNKYPSFTKFISSVQHIKLLEAISKKFDFSKAPLPIDKVNIENFVSQFKKSVGDLIDSKVVLENKHLPVNSECHLEFPLIIKDNRAEFIYTSCQRCENLDEHGFPEICLRGSIDFGQKIPNMYDNRISINHQTRELMVDMYLKFRDFIESTKIN